ncbi:helix-turn-helix transcriptional regulator [Kribbella sp. NPDC026596]|uniref:helix-turn-helix domain-containing protein n=1 Tax=Kribbella sp. NPDC026596 TaxID=3155122 RepID=UPI00340073D3
MFEDRSDLAVDRHLVVSHRLRARRLQLGLTQKQLVSRLARRGIRTTNKTLSSFEHGAGVDVVRLPELAAALDCTVTFLLGLTEDPARWEPDRFSAAPDDHQVPRPAVLNSPGILKSSSVNHPDGHWILGPDIPARPPRR